MQEQDPIKPILDLDEAVSGAVAKRVVPRLPDGVLKPNQQLDPNIKRVVVDRLVHLHYLEKRSGVSNNELTNAVKDLQAEAGLATDKWLGFQTWQAIQQVFTFEEPTHLERWIVDETPSDFIMRAAYVRLRALGIIEGAAINFSIKYNATEAPIQRKYAVDNGLARFREILLLLGYDKEKLVVGQGYHLGLFEVLFDHDLLIESMSSNRASIQALLKGFKPYSPKKKENNQLERHALRFLCYLCKIELWLHDYGNDKNESDPDGSVINPKATKISFNKYLEGKQIPSNLNQVSFRGFMSSAIRFCDDSGVDKKLLFCMGRGHTYIKKRMADNRVGHVEIALDILTCAVPSITVDVPKRVQAERLLESLKNQRTDKKLDDADTWEAAGFGNAILDGAKRVWRFAKEVISWIINAAKKMFKAIKRRISQVVRIAKKFAFEGLAILRRAYIAIEMGAKLLLNAEIPGSNKFIAMKKDIDMDFTVAVSEDATSTHITEFLSRLKQGVEGFQFSVVLIKVVTAAIALVVKIYTMPISGPLAIISKLLTIERFLDDHEYDILHRTLLVK